MWTQYVVKPPECINQISSWYLKTFRKSLENSREAGNQGPPGPKSPNCNKINRSKKIHCISVNAEFGGFIELMRSCVQLVKDTCLWWNSILMVQNISTHVEKEAQITLPWRGALLGSPFRVFVTTRGPQIVQPWPKLVRLRIAMYKCVDQILSFYIFLKIINQKYFKYFWL